MTGMECDDKYCGEKVLLCSKPNTDILELSDRRERTTGYFSEENSGMGQCPDGYAISGMKCGGKDCDNIKLYCKKYKFVKTDRPLSYTCNDEGECQSFGPFVGSWKNIGSNVVSTFTSGWSKSNSEAVTVEEAKTYSESIKLGAAMSFCSGVNFGFSYEACMELSFEHTTELSFSSVFAQEYSEVVTDVEERSCTTHIPKSCEDSSFTVYQWQTQSVTSDGSTTTHSTCIHHVKCEGTISEEPNCIPNHCWDNACEDCLAVEDGTQTIINPKLGEMKETAPVENYVGCHENVNLDDQEIVTYIGEKSKDWSSIKQCELACASNQYYFLIENGEEGIDCYCSMKAGGRSTREKCDTHSIQDPSGHLSYFWHDELYAFYQVENYRPNSSSPHRRRNSSTRSQDRRHRKY